MKMAVIKTGGKQYLVTQGTRLRIEKLHADPGSAIIFETLLVSDGENTEIGKPLLEKKVEGKILKHTRGKKIMVIKYKRKVRYRKTSGHRQDYTEVEIIKI